MTENARPQEKWNEKNGYISKSFRMYRKTADEFKIACEKAGVSQSGQIVKMMQAFIDEVNE
ncbi:MAG: hypothetical protein LKG40_01510 [Lachnospiraceae bacterium]|jgi:hypothetical protein|nr:hypothetical protein [Lachnospiraceae bacterium]MCI1328029.1 hypothetical protein [Lachnospiraceae bacterium]